MNKKKVLTTSVAASLVLGSVAGLPLSPKGLANTLGVQTAYALDASALFDVDKIKDMDREEAKQKVKELLDEIKAQLSDEEKAVINEARAKFASIDESETYLVEDIWNKIAAKKAQHDPDGTTYDLITVENVMNVIKYLGQAQYDPNLDEIEDKVRGEYRDILKQLDQLAEQDGGVTDFTWSDVQETVDLVQQLVLDEISMDDLIDLIIEDKSITEYVGQVFRNVWQKVLANNNLDATKFIKGLGITADDIVNTYKKFAQRVDADYEAQKVLAAAAVRVKSELDVSVSDSNKRVLIPKLTLFNYEIPNEVLKWTVSGDHFEVDDDNNFVLKESVKDSGTYKATVEASILGFEDYVIHRGEIQLEYQADPVTPPGGGVYVPPIGGVINIDRKQAESILNDVYGNLEEIAAAAKGNSARAAREAVEKALRKAATVNAASTLVYSNDKATANFNIGYVEWVFEVVSELGKQANEKLKEVAPNAKPAKIPVIFDFGNVNVSTVEIPFLETIVNLAKQYGIDALGVVVNGVALTIDTTELGNGMTITYTKQNTTVSNAAADVYDFSFRDANGNTVTKFESPVEVRFPIKNNQVDEDLLSLTKVDGNNLILKLGLYDEEENALIADNRDFSTYTVTENVIRFNDIDSVREWAGRHIAVAAAKGIIDGRADGEFVPNDYVTRAEFAKLIVKVFNLEDDSATEPFVDVNDDDWFAPYVAAAAKAGIVNGRTDTEFAPNATITRAEMATMAARAMAKYLEYELTVSEDQALSRFVDAAEIHETLKAGVALAADHGVVEGEEANQFKPNNNATRAQAAVIIYRLLFK